MSAQQLEAALRRARPALWLLAALLLGFVAYRGAIQPERGDTRFYRRGAERFAAREPLYTAVRGDPAAPTSGYTYLPPFALAARPTLWVSPAVMRGLWPWLMAACAWGGYRALRRWSRLRGSPELPWLTLALILAICARFVWNDLRHGQTNLLVVGLLCVSLWNARCRREGPAGVALALALLIKPTAWPLGVWFLARGRLQLVGLGALAGVVGLVLPGLLYGPGDYLGEVLSWITRMRGFAADEALLDPEELAQGSTLVNAAASAWIARAAQGLGFGSPVALGRALAWLSGGCALGWTLWRRPPHGAAACVLLGAWLSPVTWKAHLVVLALPAALAARRLLARPSAALWAVWGAWWVLIALPKLLPAAEAWGSSTAALALGWWWCASAPRDAPNSPAANV